MVFGAFNTVTYVIFNIYNAENKYISYYCAKFTIANIFNKLHNFKSEVMKYLHFQRSFKY